MKIETERLTLRPFEVGDLGIILGIYGDDEIMRYMPYEIMDEDAAAAHLEKIVRAWDERPQTDYEMAIVLGGAGIGRAHILRHYDSDSAEVGWLIFPEYQGRGFATEITRALVDYCFDELGVRRVTALCNPTNVASCRVLEKCGFRREAHFIRSVRYVKHGAVSWEDEAAYGLLREETGR